MDGKQNLSVYYVMQIYIEVMNLYWRHANFLKLNQLSK